MKLSVADDVADVWDRSWVTPWGWQLLVLYNAGLGFVLLAGDPDRISNPAFATIQRVGDNTLGVVFIVLSIAMAAAAFISRRTLRWVTVAATLAHLLLAAGFLLAWVNEPARPPLELLPPDVQLPPRAALTGIPTYAFVAGVHGINSALYGPRGPLSKGGARE